MDIKKDIQTIIDYSLGFAEKMLIEYKEYYPFGVAINNKNELVPAGFTDPETDMPLSQKVIDDLTMHFNSEFEQGRIKSYGITFDSRVRVNNDGGKSDAIAICIVHKDSADIPNYYYPYSWSEKGELIFGESFGMEKYINAR